jgi:hypothetical protein
MVAEIKTMLVRRAVLSPFKTRNRVFCKEMYFARLALDAFWDDNVTIIPEFDLFDAERLVKQSFDLCKSGVHNTARNTLRVMVLLRIMPKRKEEKIPSKSI